MLYRGATSIQCQGDSLIDYYSRSANHVANFHGPTVCAYDRSHPITFRFLVPRSVARFESNLGRIPNAHLRHHNTLIASFKSSCRPSTLRVPPLTSAVSSMPESLGP